MALRQTIKGPIKAVVKPMGRAARPLAERISFEAARISHASQGLKVVWTDAWNATMDEALDHLPPPTGVTRDQYRELLMPTRFQKRHALVLKNDTPLALISVRRRNTMWEPVAYQALPNYIAPAVDLPSLGAAINALGIELVVESGLEADAELLQARHVSPYGVVRVMLQTDYEAFWLENDRKHMIHVTSARRKCKRMHIEVDGDGDLEWTVKQWEEQWADSPSQEIVSAPDRLRFWKAIQASGNGRSQFRMHSYLLYNDDERVAGVINSSIHGKQLGQCLGHLPKYRNRGSGTRALDLALQHAAGEGFEYLDFGGGHGYKSLWGPYMSQRYSAIFRPKLIEALQWSRN